MTTTKHTATNPFNPSDVATRNSKTKTYSHCVFVFRSAETVAAKLLREAEANEAEAAKYEAEGYQESIRAEFEAKFGNGDETAAKVPEWAAAARRAAADRRQRAAEATEESGDYTWCSRLDLAEKQASSLMKKGYYDAVRIVETTIL